MRIVAEVPRLYREVVAFKFMRQFPYLFNLLFRRGFVGVDKVVEQFVDILRIACHAVFQHIVGISVVAEQLCNLPSQVHDALANLYVVLFVVVCTLRVLRHV